PDWKDNLEIKTEPVTLPRNRLLHWGPIVALSITFIIGCVSSYFATMWWPINTTGGFLNLVWFLFWNYSVMVNLSKASFTGPGHSLRSYNGVNRAPGIRCLARITVLIAVDVR
ncbi:unnamed protein product, partial [Nippostrongylus brasiliensis]|uniref:Palmitoyltransferase ZDHHC6 (inferred by orthology to a human protein) n=1 Tax=Nippostrongylus brasiliensis TaxID=27835 RepID=A0A0N4XRS8_NIPBR